MKGLITPGTRYRETEYLLDGKRATKEEFDAAFPRKIDEVLKAGSPQNTLMQTSKSWPRKSDSLGVHPSQKKAAEAQAEKMGVKTEFDGKTGQAIIRDNAHQRDLQKALGWRNNDGGYNQVTG